MVFSVDDCVSIKLLGQKSMLLNKIYRKISQQAVDTVWIKQTVA